MISRTSRVLLPRGFRICFPLLSWWVERPRLTVAVLTGLGLMAGFSLEPILGLGIFCLGMPLISLGLERKVLDQLLLPPFTVTVFWGALGCGLGVPLLSLFDPPEWKDSYLKIQLVFLACLPVAWIFYDLGGWRRISAAGIPHAEKPGDAGLTVLAWSWFLAGCVLQLTRSSLGLDNRGAAHPSLQPNWDPFGWSFFLRLLPRLDLLGYFFMPFLWRGSKNFQRWIMVTLLGLVLSFAVFAGARGLVLYPACYIFLGAYFFRSSDSARFEKNALILALSCLAVVAALLIYRSSPLYSPPRPFSSGISASAEPVQMEWKSSFRNTGYSLLGVEDVKVYEKIPRELPLAGWENFRAIFYTWVPSYLARTKPVLLDGDRVAGSLQDPPQQTLMGFGISLTADAYRRFGWAGIWPAVAVAFFLYGWLIRWLLNRPRPGSLFSWGALVMTLGLFHGSPFGGTLLSTWHLFFYNLPKHLAALWLGCLLLEWICRPRSQTGFTAR